MADKPNKSNKPINGEVPKHLRDVFEQRDYNVSYEHLSTKEGMPKLSQRLEALEQLKGMSSDPSVNQQIAENIGFTEADMAEEIDRLEKIYGSRYNESLAASVETYTKYRNVNNRTTTMAGQQRFGRMAQGHKDLYMPTEMIEARNQTLMEQASQIGGRLAGEARDLGTDADTASLMQGASKIGAIQEEIALNKRLMKHQARHGLSTEKLVHRGEDLDQAVAEFLQKKGVESRVDTGNVRSYAEEVKVMGHMRSNRNQLQEQYNDAIENGSETASVFAEKLKKANDALDTQTRLVKRMSDKGMDRGDGGFFGRYGAAIQGAAYLGGTVANVAGNINQVAGNQDILQMTNRASFAAMGNAIYGKAEAAVFKNDVDAALEVIGSDKFAQAYADRNRKLAHGTGWTGALGRAVGSIGGGAMKGAMLGGGAGLALAGVGAAPGALIGGIAGGVSGISDAVSEFSNLGYGNVGADASIRSYQAAKNLSAQERMIRAQQMQSFYSHGLGVYNNAMGLGNTNAFSAGSNLNNQAYLSQLGAAGISATQARNLLPTLGQAGAFDFENEGLPAMMSAGRAAQRGVMSREGYMSTFARLRAMGGSDDDLQKVITAGFENAKNINQMVDASMQMSTNLANLGVSGVGSTSDMLTASTQMLKNIGVDPNLAIGMAANNMSNYNKQITDQGFNLGNIVERQQLRMNPNFSGASIFQLNQLSQMSAQEHQVFRRAGDGDEEALKQARILARNKGISGLMFDAEGGIKSGAVNSLGGSALTGALLNVGAAGMNRDVVKRLQAGETLTDEQRAILANAGFTEETAMAALGSRDVTRTPKDLEFYLQRDGQKRDQTAADRERRNIAKGEQYAKELDPTKKAFENIENMMATVSEMAAPEKFGEVVGKAAEDFRVPVGEFGDHVKTMGTMLDNVVQQQNQMLRMMGEKRGKDYTQGLFSKEKE